MRILQIIDSLEIGGAERMAVNYANALSKKIEFSGIVVTRKEGDLRNKIELGISYFFLSRKSKIDIKAVLKLKKICSQNKITHLQAHSSSFFIAFLTKLFLPKIKIIWHDHNGLSEFISTQKSYVLKFVSLFFSGIVVVNDKLKKWAEKELNCNNVIYFPNFTSIENEVNSSTILKGIDGKKILCLANLRFQKNHFFLIEVAKIVKKRFPDWSFHLIGKDFEDDYSLKVKSQIKEFNLEENVFVYGSKNDVQNIINQSEIAILTSQSEGLPVAILEYGLNKMPLVTTNVGEIPNIVINGLNGFITDKKDYVAFANYIIQLIEDKNLRINLSNNLFETIHLNFSENSIIENYTSWLKNI
jgi:glycosyltransferase involved in cell wall biosynthesis